MFPLQLFGVDTTPERLDDRLLESVRRLKSGETSEPASEYLVRSFQSRLQAYFRNHGFLAEDAEDLVQETFRRVFRGIEGLKDEARFLGWLFQIARNVRLTARSTMSPVTWVGIDEVRIPSRESVNTERTDKLDKAWHLIEKLPGQQKQCLMLRVLREMSYDEIARVLKLSTRTVRNHLREARLRLRQEIGDV